MRRTRHKQGRSDEQGDALVKCSEWLVRLVVRWWFYQLSAGVRGIHMYVWNERHHDDSSSSVV